MSDGEREIEIETVGDSDDNAHPRHGAGSGADSASDDAQRSEGDQGSRAADSGENVNDLTPWMGNWRNQEYGEVM